MRYFKKVNTLLLLAFFYLIFTFTFKEVGTIHKLVIYGICGIYIILNKRYLLKYLHEFFYKTLRYSIIGLVICFIATIVIPWFFGTNDYSYIETLSSILRTLIKLLALLIMFEKTHKEEANIKLFSQYIVLATCIYIFTTIFFLAFPSLKGAWNNVIDDPDYHIVVENKTYMSRYGIMGYSGFQIAFKVVFAIAVSGYLIIEEKLVVNKSNFLLYITYVILIIGSFFYGRIGMVVSLVLVAIIAFLFIKKKKRRIVYLIIGIGIIAGVAVFLYNYNKQTKLWVDWAFAPFVNYIKTGKIYTGSSDRVFKKMIFMPELKTFLIRRW